MADEFELIERFFTSSATSGDGVRLGIGDDAAVLEIPPDRSVVDAMSLHAVPPDADAFVFGSAAIEDALARAGAAGAQPRWFTLALTLPEADEAWLGGLSRAVRDAERRHGVRLVGGDTTQGPGALAVCVFALLPARSRDPGDADSGATRGEAERA